MAKLRKTRALINTLLEKERIADQGYPITDTDKNEVSKELHEFETGYSTYRFYTFTLLITFSFIILRYTFESGEQKKQPDTRLETQEPEPTYQNETIYKPVQKYVDEYDSIYWKQTHY